MHETDRLVRRAQAGDKEAFEQLVMPLERKIYTLCFRITGSKDEAFDCAQETMLRVYRRLRDYKFHSAFSTWVYRVATNVCIDMVRRNRAKAHVSLDSLANASSEITQDEVMSPYDSVIKSEELGLLQFCITKLPLEMRMCLVLRDIHGLSYDDLARVLSINKGTVKSRLFRARERLRRLLVAYGEDNDGTNENNIRLNNDEMRQNVRGDDEYDV